jgi:hypothetical protein
MKIVALSLIAKCLGIQFKIDGPPYGAKNYQRLDDSLSQAAQPKL